jgi:hypothetical protein
MNPRIPQIIEDLVRFETSLRNPNGTQEIDQLLANVKHYAAELYLETDMEIIARGTSPTAPTHTPTEAQPVNLPIVEVVEKPMEQVFKPEFEDDIDSESLQQEALQQEEERIEPPQDEQEVVPEPVPELSMEKSPTTIEDLNFSPETDPVEEHSEALKSNHIVDVAPDLFSSEISEDADIQEEAPKASVSNTHLEQKATEILGMFSFSRRFEFGNFLFAGDMKLFAVFITEMLAASSIDEREDVFDRWYQERQWSRRDESANDLKRNLKKML